MNTAWSVGYVLWSPLHKLLRALSPVTPPRATRPGQHVLPRAASGAPALATQPVARPLRVVRVIEAGQQRSQVGRMVISGCMADVCAELDRLAACEGVRP